MKKLVRDLRAGDVVDFCGRVLTIRRVSKTRGDWNNAQIYFREGGSTKLRRDYAVTLAV